MNKYPRTPHLPCSPEIHSDDKVCNLVDLKNIIDGQYDVVILEKLDGGCTKLSDRGVFARSHIKPTSCSSFDYIKNVHYYPNQLEIAHNLKVFGENMFAIHSIEYTGLTDYFYVFNILEKDKERFMSYDIMKVWAENHGMQTVPLIYMGKIPSIVWLENFLKEELLKPSALGGTREGFVIRLRKSFHQDDFSKNVFKYVRKGHVQTDEHWSKNWKQALLKGKE